MGNLGAANIGGYNTFLKNMLDLREQRLQEERYKQLERMEQQKQMMDTIGDIGSGISGAFQKYQENKLGNQLSEEYFGAPPRAGAVDTPWSDQLAAGKPGFYTGGMPEFKMRMAMEENLSNAQYKQAIVNRMGENLKFQKSKWLVNQAQVADKGKRTKLDDDYDDYMKYITKRKVLTDAIENSASPEQHEQNATHLMALDGAAKKRGLDMSGIDTSAIPPYMSQADKDTLESQQTAVTQARKDLQTAKEASPDLIESARGWLGMPSGGLFGHPSDREKAVQTAQQLYEREQQKLRETPGASYYGERPARPKESEPARKSGTLTEATPVGATKPFRDKATKKLIMHVWDGTQWVPQ